MAPKGPSKSEASVSSYGASSEGSSAHGSDASAGVVRDEDGADLKGSSSSKKETFFGAMYYACQGRILEGDWRFLILNTLFSWVQLLNLIFSPHFYGWDVDWEGNNWWRFYRRLLISNAAAERGWGLYVGVLLVFVILYVVLLAVFVWLNFAVKTRTKFRWQWPGHLFRILLTLSRSFYISFVSLLTVSFTCNNNTERTMFYFPDKGCFVMPQAILFGVCLVVELLFLYPVFQYGITDAGDTDYYSKNFYSSSVGAYSLRLHLVRMALPLVPMAVQLFPKWHGFFNFILTSYYLIITVRRAPMHRTWLNCVNSFLALFLWWAAALGFLGVFYPQYMPGLTIAFLAGMFPLGFVCAGITYLRLRRMWRVAQRFSGWTLLTPLRETYHFWDEYEVEIAARVCRKTITTKSLDVIPDPKWTGLADKVVQAGMVQFPDSAFLNIIYASLQAALLNDPSGGMAQLQKARKCGDVTWVQLFQIYVREQEKLAQKGKDQDQSSTFDAATWAEFQANYRAAIRCHRGALTTLKAFWHLLLRSDVSMVAVVRYFLRIPSARDAAEHSYKALMERYPNNPRVLRAFARFLQQVKNDPSGSTRYLALADKVEEQQDESRREVIFSQLIDRKFKDEESAKAMAMIDETMDAVILINSEGMMQYVNAPAMRMFGYRKGELEGRNISMLMPAPFSQQHDGYLHNYMTSRKAKILDTTREVVGLHKLRHVFPVSLCVTPIMMGAAECFMGVIKALEDDASVATAYCTANGTVVCISRGFSNILAHQSSDVIGHAMHEFTTTHDKINQIIAAVTVSDGKEKVFGKLLLMHKFGEEVEVEVLGRRAGTDAVRITVLEMTNQGNQFTGLITVSPATARITYANTSFCEFIGISADHLIKLRLHEIMTEPFAQLHSRWIKGRDLSRAPGLKCRSGRAVDFRHSSGKVVPALMELSERSTELGNVWNVKVAPIKDKAEIEWNRISLTVAPDGTVTGHTGKLALFGVDREALVGKPLDVLLDLYRREGAGGVAATHAKLLQDMKEHARTLRVAVAPRGMRTVPAVMQLLPPGEEGSGATMHLYRADCLEAVLELDAACKVKKCSEEAALLFGITPEELIGANLQKVLPKACPSGKTSELLAAKGQRGGSKQKVGQQQSAEGVHSDGKPLHIQLHACESTERPGRYLVRIVVPKPISAYSMVGADAVHAGGVRQSGMGSKAAAAPEGSLRSFFQAAGGGSRPVTGGGCPFHFGAAPPPSASPAPPSPLGLPPLSDPGVPASAAGGSLSRPATGGSSCPFGFGSSKQEGQQSHPGGSRPGTRGGACPINFDTAEVLSSLSFPAGSRFAMQKAHAEAAAAATASADKPGQQASEEEEGGVDPNLDGESSPGCTAESAPAAVSATAEQEQQQAVATETTLPPAQQAGEGGAEEEDGRPATGWDGGLVFSRRDDFRPHYNQPTAAFRFKELGKLPQRVQSAAPRARVPTARPVTAAAVPAVMLPDAGTSQEATSSLQPASEASPEAAEQSSQAQQQSPAPAVIAAAVVPGAAAAGEMADLRDERAGRVPKADSTAVLITARAQGPAANTASGPPLGTAPGTAVGTALDAAGESAAAQVDEIHGSQHTEEEEEEEAGGAEEEVDPAELAAKMEAVSAWLDTTPAPEAAGAEAGSKAASRPVTATAAGALVVPGGGAEEPELEVITTGGAAGPLALRSKAGAMAATTKAADAASGADGSSVAGSDTASMAASGDDDGADYSRLKRYRKAYKLLNSPRARAAINALKAQTRYVLLVMVVAHIAFFATSLAVLNSSLAYVENLDKAGMGARNAISVCTDLRSIQWAAQEILQFGSVQTYPEPHVTAANMLKKALILEENQKDLYFGKGSAAAATTAMYDETFLNCSVYMETTPPTVAYVSFSLWDSIQRLINAVKEVAAMTEAQWETLATNFAYRFAMDNSPEGMSMSLLKVVDMEAWMAVEKLRSVGLVTWILLGIEAGVIIPLCALYLFRLLRAVAIERFNLFSIFLFIPRPAVLALARAEIVVDELDESDDEDDEVAALAHEGTGAGAGAAAGTVNTAANARVLAQKAAQSKLAISRRAIGWLMLPFAVWLGAVALLWGLQFWWVSGASERVMGLDASERAFVYNARVRFFANELVVEANDITDDTHPEIVHLKFMLNQAAERLQFYYELSLYGDSSPYRHLNASMNLAKKNYPGLKFQPTLYSNVERNKLLYDPGCLRTDKSTCYQPTDSFYYTTNYGLNNMLYYYVEQAVDLAADLAANIDVNHPAIKYIFPVGVMDMVGALESSNQIFMFISNFTYTRILQAIILAFSIVAALAYLWFMARPYIAVTLLESKRVAEVLSLLPNGVDIGALMALSGQTVSAEPGGGWGRQSSQSQDSELA